MNKPYEGLFVTIEGGDGSGKTTLAEQLVWQLSRRGYSLFHTREPGGTALAEQLRKILLNRSADYAISEEAELLLFLTARVQHLEEKILPALRLGKVVLCERFNDSSIAYQGCARHLGMGYVEELCKLACHGIEPQCTLFLDIDPEKGLKRTQQQRKNSLDRFEHEHLQFHREVRQGFLHLADKHPQRIQIIDADQPLELVLENALKVLEPFLMLKPSSRG